MRRAMKDTIEAINAYREIGNSYRQIAARLGNGITHGDVERIVNKGVISLAKERELRVRLGLPVPENLWPYKDKEQRQRVREDERTLSQIIEDGLDAGVRDDCAYGVRDNTATS